MQRLKTQRKYELVIIGARRTFKALDTKTGILKSSLANPKFRVDRASIRYIDLLYGSYNGKYAPESILD